MVAAAFLGGCRLNPIPPPDSPYDDAGGAEGGDAADAADVGDAAGSGDAADAG